MTYLKMDKIIMVKKNLEASLDNSDLTIRLNGYRKSGELYNHPTETCSICGNNNRVLYTYIFYYPELFEFPYVCVLCHNKIKILLLAI